MAEASIPVDLFNPGQVFACLGFMEAAEILLGDAEGGFDWSDETNVRFKLRAAGDRNPFEAVLEFLAEADPQRWGPIGYVDPPPKKKKGKGADEEDAADEEADDDDDDSQETDVNSAATSSPAAPSLDLCETFGARVGDKMSLPIRFGGGNRPVVELGHWADGSSRESFKLYAGNRSAHSIAKGMLLGVRAKPSKKQKAEGIPGEPKFKGIRQLWEEQHDALVNAPLDTLTPMGGSFNFDPRGAWTAIDAGYSPNKQKHPVNASPVVEFLAAWGLEHARPDEFETRRVRYAVWGQLLPPLLARAAVAGGVPTIPLRRFEFELDLSGKNKVVTFAQEEAAP
jgi:CRISPR-associated protein Csx14